MSVDPALRQIKRRSKDFADRRRVVTGNRQTAAPFRTVQRKCPNNHGATGAYGSQNSFDIGRTLARISQKMERGAVVPHIVRSAWFPSGHINGNPLNLCSALRTQPCLRCFEGFFGKIKDTDGAIAFGQKRINEPRRASAYIND
jgi:hypothetical protein